MQEVMRSCAAIAMGAALFTQGALAQTDPATRAEQFHTVRELSLSAARGLVEEGLKSAAEKDMRLTISVVDRAGDLLAFARMDGASIATVDVSIGKARTAALIKAPTKRFEDMLNSGSPSMATAPGLVMLRGGVPVIHDGEVVGAVGVSGSSGENDQAVATEIANNFLDPRTE